jgi:hypothetical protein
MSTSKDLSSCEDWSPGLGPSWLVLMRETWSMVEGDYDGVEVATQGGG